MWLIIRLLARDEEALAVKLQVLLAVVSPEVEVRSVFGNVNEIGTSNGSRCHFRDRKERLTDLVDLKFVGSCSYGDWRS